ncbi:hypothetical protein C0J45_22489 [Silurus meridionalis]|nr:hypothetical protein C0J45_22489 [Silurus meridionalis]
MQLWVCCALLVFLAEGCLAQRPHPCRSPPLLEGHLSVTTQNGGYFAYGKYAYDAILQRIRFGELVHHENQTLVKNVLLLYREHVMYLIDYKNKTCEKRQLTSQFHPMKIPRNATLLGQVVLGSLSAPGEGLLVNSWTGEAAEDQVRMVDLPVRLDQELRVQWEGPWLCVQKKDYLRYQPRCLRPPGCYEDQRQILYYHPGQGWVYQAERRKCIERYDGPWMSQCVHAKGGILVLYFFNNIRGIKDPAVFIPPGFCKNATVETGEEGDFFSAFF